MAEPLIERDYFTDYDILKDPYAYFSEVRRVAAVFQPPGRDFFVVTGFEEALQILRDGETFSSAIALQGAGAPLPFQPHGSDINEQLDAHRLQFEGPELVVNLDDKAHHYHRTLINSLFTPSRLKANEAFIEAYSDTIVREAVRAGDVELISKVATPFVTLVIADLLGVPDGDRQEFIDIIEAAPPPGSLDGPTSMQHEDHPFVKMGAYFVGYVQDRKANPRGDILSELANATYPDGTSADVMDIVKLAMFMFGAGQDTSAKLLGNTMKFIVQQPGLQQQLREDPSLIPALMEEMLRLEGSAKQTARLARKDTEVGGVPIPAGSKLLVAISAANRDPLRWPDPDTLELKRPRIKEHLGFGRGAHVCAGAPLARVEVRVLLEKFLEYTSHIDLNAQFHGPPADRRFDYEASFIIRGLADLHVQLTPSQAFVDAEAATKTAATPPSRISDASLSVSRTKIGDLLKDPRTKSLLDKHFPGVSADKRIGLGKGMTLKGIQSFAPGMFSDDALDEFDNALASLPNIEKIAQL